MRLVAPDGLSAKERIEWYDVPENKQHYLYGTRGGWVKYEKNPVLANERYIGTCFDMSVVKHDGFYHMWFSWRPHCGIGYVKSIDGYQWSAPTLVLGPVVGSRYESDEVNRPSVIYKDGYYHMWYSGQVRPYREDGFSDICYARSSNGIDWERPLSHPVLSPSEPWEQHAIMSPHVLYDEDEHLYKMWYGAGNNHEPDAIGYASSSDGFQWTKAPCNPILTPDTTLLWEQHKLTGPHVIKYDGWYYMFYIGHMHEERAAIGLCRSRNGINGWERHPENPLISPEPEGYDAVSVYKPFVLKESTGWICWYNGAEFEESIWVFESIAVATHPGEALFPEA